MLSKSGQINVNDIRAEKVIPCLMKRRFFEKDGKQFQTDNEDSWIHSTVMIKVPLISDVPQTFFSVLYNLHQGRPCQLDGVALIQQEASKWDKGVSGSDSCQGRSTPYVGDGRPLTWIMGNPYNGYINPYSTDLGWWVYPLYVEIMGVDRP